MFFQWSAVAAASLYKRSNFDVSEALIVIGSTADNGAPHADAANTAWWYVLLVLNVIIWVPTLFFLGYTLNKLIPVLAAIEDDDAPPFYKSVALTDDTNNKIGKIGANEIATEESGGRSQRHGPVTAGVWATIYFLYSTGGWRSFFRGFGYAALLHLARLLVSLIVFACAPPVMAPIAALIIFDLATVQFSAVWLHAVISTSDDRWFWQRLPSFKTAFQATALPIIIVDLALLLCDVAANHMYGVLGASVNPPVAVESDHFMKILSAPFIAILLLMLVSIPANVVLLRCQASLLPENAQTIVPFDHTFQLESVREKGYATMVEAWKTFSRVAWKRLVMVYVKVTLITMLMEVLMSAIIFAQAVFVMSLIPKYES